MLYFGTSHVFCSNNGDSGIFSVGSLLVTVALIIIEAASMGDSGRISFLSLFGAYNVKYFFHSPFSFENTSPFCTLSIPVASLGICSYFSHERTSFPMLYKK